MGSVLPITSRPFNFFLALGVPLALMVLLLTFDPGNIDLRIEHLFYSPDAGFVGKRFWWFEDVLHDGAKQGVIVIAVTAITGFMLSFFPTRFAIWRRQLGYVVLAMAMSTSIVMPLKNLTQVHCPWSLTEFGGTETHSPLLGPRAPTSKPGKCWPGGHASGGFSLLAFYFVFRDRRQRWARLALLGALGLGIVFSLGRTMQGAHFISHNVWTFLIDWVICVVTYRLVLYRSIPVGTAQVECSASD